VTTTHRASPRLVVYFCELKDPASTLPMTNDKYFRFRVRPVRSSNLSFGLSRGTTLL